MPFCPLLKYLFICFVGISSFQVLRKTTVDCARTPNAQAAIRMVKPGEQAESAAASALRSFCSELPQDQQRNLGDLAAQIKVPKWHLGKWKQGLRPA